MYFNLPTYILLALVAIFSTIHPIQAIEQQQSKSFLRIFHFNDVYQLVPDKTGQGGIAELNSLLKVQRNKAKRQQISTLTTFGGDLYPAQLGPIDLNYNEVVQLLNNLNLDFAVFGNHEFDEGINNTIEMIKSSQFPWLGDNILYKGFPLVPSPKVLNIQGKKVGIVSLVLPSTSTTSNPGPEVSFSPIIESTQKQLSNLQKEKVDLIIALTHLTYEQDKKVLKTFPQISLILGGHDHHPISELIGNSLLYKAGMDMEYLGIIDIKLTPSPLKTSPQMTWTTLANLNQPKNSKIENEIQLIQQKYRSKMTKNQAVILKLPIGIDARHQFMQKQESQLGLMVADAMVYHFLKRKKLNVDIAFLNSGAIRSDRFYPKGHLLTRAELNALLPFKDKIVLLEGTGSEILKIFENAIAEVWQDVRRFPHVNESVQIKFASNRPSGKRILQFKINGKLIHPQQTYVLATTLFLYNGGDDFDFSSFKNITPQPQENFRPRTLFLEYINDHKKNGQISFQKRYFEQMSHQRRVEDLAQ